MALTDYLAGEVAHDFADGLLSRREALRRLVMLGLTAAGATALLAACSANGDKNNDTSTGVTSTTAGTSASAPGTEITFSGPRGELRGSFAAAADVKGSALVVHENRGLTPHFFDLIKRLAAAGYSALCVDLLSDAGGTASLSDPAAAPAALSAKPLEHLMGDLRAGIDELQRRAPRHKVGAVGFCFGGGMVWNLVNAGEARLAAAVPFYGPAPERPDFTKAKAAVLAIYGDLDTFVNPTRDRAESALKAAGLHYEIKSYPGANHAFFNDTGPRYNEAAAKDAYAKLLDWFGRYLA